MNADYYKLLEIPSDATQEQIKEQYRFLLHAWHPDKFRKPEQKLRAQERTKALNEAYEILGDPNKRAQYDAIRSQEQPRQSHSTEKEEASKADPQRHEEKRARYERKRETEAEIRWRAKVEAEGLGRRTHSAKAKPSFLKGLFNKGRCAVGLHKGQWFYDEPDQCTQIRLCELCSEISTRTQHEWTEWRYRSYDNCQCVRGCKRCGEADYDTQHNWTHWEYLHVNDCTKVQVCGRCKKKSEHTKVVHEWKEWSYDDRNHLRTRTCQRCHEEMSELAEPSEPEMLSEPEPVTVRESISSSGIWVAGDGLPIHFQQVGKKIFFQGVNARGVVVVQGQGVIQGYQAHLTFEYYDGYTYDKGKQSCKFRRTDGKWTAWCSMQYRDLQTNGACKANMKGLSERGAPRNLLRQSPPVRLEIGVVSWSHAFRERLLAPAAKNGCGCPD